MTRERPPKSDRSAPRGAKRSVIKSKVGPYGLTDPHVLKALEYCEKVLSGEIAACKWVKKACRRQLADLERSEKDPTWDFDFVEALAGRACRFLEQLPHVKGPKGGELFQLELWQCFIVTTVFGWIRRSTGARRFRKSYTEVPRGNGKSFMSSGVGLFGVGADGEQGAEVYSAATTTEQANITRGDAEKMLKKRPVLINKLGLTITAHAIAQKGSNSTFKALSREADNQDGKNIHIALVDELHAHKKRDVWDVLITGAGKRPNSLIWTITTAGVNVSGICYEVRGDVVKMLDGATNDGLFGIIYTLDPEETTSCSTRSEVVALLEDACNCSARSTISTAFPGEDLPEAWEPERVRESPPLEAVRAREVAPRRRIPELEAHASSCRVATCEATDQGDTLNVRVPADDWKVEPSWIKANPNWHSSIDHDFFMMNATEALQTASKENNFKTKHLNLWCNAETAWMQMAAWDACADPSLAEESFAGQPCVIGLDLASKVDIIAKVNLFYRDFTVGTDPKTGEPVLERQFYLFTHSYLPEGAIGRSKNAQYRGWAKDGWIKATDGDVIDFEVLKDDLIADSVTHQVKEVAFDPWQARQLANELQAKGFTMVEVAPTVQNFSEPMKLLESLVLAKRLHHDGNPAMRWMVSNVVCHHDAKDNVYPRKERQENKIDGPVAAIMALNRAALAPPVDDGPGYLATSGAVILG